MLRVLIFVVSLGARALRAMCRRRADLVIENLALRQQVAALKKERRRPRLKDMDRAFWSRSGSRGPCGPIAWSSSMRTPSRGGIGTDSAAIGRGSRGDAVQVDPGPTPRFVTSSPRWHETVGAHLASTQRLTAEQLSPTTPDPALRDPVLPRAVKRRADRPRAHRDLRSRLHLQWSGGEIHHVAMARTRVRNCRRSIEIAGRFVAEVAARETTGS
jgi:hypothetical protein